MMRMGRTQTQKKRGAAAFPTYTFKKKTLFRYCVFFFPLTFMLWFFHCVYRDAPVSMTDKPPVLPPQKIVEPSDTRKASPTEEKPPLVKAAWTEVPRAPESSSPPPAAIVPPPQRGPPAHRGPPPEHKVSLLCTFKRSHSQNNFKIHYILLIKNSLTPNLDVDKF